MRDSPKIMQLVAAASLLLVVCAPRMIKGLTQTPRHREHTVASLAPQRIASVSLVSDTVLLRLLGTERLAAVSWVVDWPEHSPYAGQVPSSIPRLTGDPEAIVALRPDLAVLADHSTPGLAATLLAAGIATLELHTPSTLDAVIGDVERVGRSVGAARQAAAWAIDLRKRLGAVETHARRRTKKRVLIVDSGYAQGLGTLADDLLLRLNSTNPVREAGLPGTLPIDAERLIVWHPQVVFVAVSTSLAGADARSELAQIPGHELLQHAREWSPVRVIGVARSALSSVSPLAIDALEAMDRILEELQP
jgi:ABC-type Fe3+-hydroxamate transport system substrate-binding protein